MRQHIDILSMAIHERRGSFCNIYSIHQMQFSMDEFTFVFYYLGRMLVPLFNWFSLAAHMNTRRKFNFFSFEITNSNWINSKFT